MEKVKALGKERLISLPLGSEKAREAWVRMITEREPSMVQMASVDGESVWELVRLLGERLDIVGAGPNRVGAWIWAVLGKCPERGQCVSEEIGELRVMARAAVELLQEGDGSGDGRESEHAAGTQEEYRGAKSWQTTSMVLDMILTIVGEVYGQRDLLEERRTWERQET